MGSFLLPCATTGGALLAVWCVIGAAPRGQPWTPAVTLLHVRDGRKKHALADVHYEVSSQLQCYWAIPDPAHDTALPGLRIWMRGVSQHSVLCACLPFFHKQP